MTPVRAGSVVAILGLVIVVYGQTINHEFVHHDDGAYVFRNPHVQEGLAAESIRWAFTSAHAANWHPITWLSHMLDVQLFGLDAGWHHMSSVGIHALAALLLLWVLYRMTGAWWPSTFVAALFAVHPMNVESVAWVAERKNVLSTLFLFLSMLAYLRYVEKRGAARYALLLMLFALGLMAKPMLVTLPFALLLLDVWPLRRWTPFDTGWRSALRSACPLIIEKVPLFVLAAISSVITIIVQREGGTVQPLDAYPLALRFTHALVTYLAYPGYLFWPTGLTVFYPHSGEIPPFWQWSVAGIALALITLLVVKYVRAVPWLFTGWFWYLGTLVPVIGFVQVGQQAMADRYMYVPAVGLFVALAWSVTGLIERTALGRAARITMTAVAVFALVALTARAWDQTRYWEDTKTLFTRAIAVTEGNYLAHNNLGNAYKRAGDPERAIKHYRRAVGYKPDHATALNNLGVVFSQLGRLEEGVAYMRKATEALPGFLDAHLNLGVGLAMLGRPEEAEPHLRYVAANRPHQIDGLFSLGTVLQQQGRIDEAVRYFEESLRVQPDFEPARRALDEIRQSRGRPIR